MGDKVVKTVFQGEVGFGRNGCTADKQTVHWGAGKKVKTRELINVKSIREQCSSLVIFLTKIVGRKAKHHDWWMKGEQISRLMSKLLINC